jgi:beta-xylosidase
MKIFTSLIFCTFFFNAIAQKQYLSKVWVADNGDNTYTNPVINADYSDPDAIRVGDNFYLVSSSFECSPALPILQSKDLVNWKIIGHALNRQIPLNHFALPRHGEGVWAPSIRFHNGEFYIYYPDPDFGIYMVKAKHAEGPWSEPILVQEGKGLIDPCPLWDSDGQVYLVHAFAGTRAGIKSILIIKKLNKEGTKVLDDGILVYDGHEQDPTIEGPKLYKRNGYYYIFAPAGGVSSGWQVVLRSKKIYGPYERRVVMDQGTSPVNGPHQGAWVTTQTGEDWFLHFQDKKAYGRVVHLQQVKWINNWPVIGEDKDKNGIGEPVLKFRKPNVGKAYPVETPGESDEFNDLAPGLQWQWAANPKPTWSFLDKSLGCLRLFSDKLPGSFTNLYNAPNLLLQKFPADEFMVTTKVKFVPNPKLENERAGLVIMGLSYANIAMKKSCDGIVLVFTTCIGASDGNADKEVVISKITNNEILLRVKVYSGAKCLFSYSIDGKNFISAGGEFVAEPGKWMGAKVGIFCTRDNQVNDSGWADFDWFRVEANN